MRKQENKSLPPLFFSGRKEKEGKDSTGAAGFPAGKNGNSGRRRQAGKRWIKALLKEAAIAWLFYRNLLCVVLLLPLTLYLEKQDHKKEEEKRQERLRSQYADGLRAFSSALKAGYAPENAISFAARECRILYGQEAEITREYERMEQQVRMMGSPEAAFEELARRTGIPEAYLFSEVFGIARRSGGNLIQVVEETQAILEDHIRTREEIRTSLRGREMEQGIMNAAPLLLLLYFNVFSPGYLDRLYKSAGGMVILSACLALYLFACRLGEKILEAEKV